MPPSSRFRVTLSTVAPAVVVALLLGSCSAEEAGSRRPEVVEVRGTAPSTAVPRAADTLPVDTTFPEFTGTGPGSTLGVPIGPGGATTSTTSVKSARPFQVETGQVTFTDTTRPTPPRGSAEAKTSRSLLTTMYVPVNRPKAPLLVFAIGFNASAEMYDTFIRELAANGYMVAVPEFPLATSTLPGAPKQEDLANQPGDITFVLDSLIDLNKQEGPFFNAIDPQRIGVVGHSDGGNTVSAIALNSCCLDSRVRAVVSIAGEKAFLPDTWTNTAALPYLAIHGTADEITPYERSKALYDGAGSPKFLVSIDGGDHLGPVKTEPLRPAVANLVTAFVDFYVDARSEAFEQFTQAAAVPPFRLDQA